jgi:hypothetical protein
MEIGACVERMKGKVIVRQIITPCLQIDMFVSLADAPTVEKLTKKLQKRFP